jgi:GH24 family phage-related lysozyme (muramidase)
MKVSINGLNLIKQFEGCRLKAYQDSVGVWTIGYGTTNADRNITGINISKNTSITQQQADSWLKDSLDKKYGPKVNKYDSIYNWTQNEFDGLISFAYNIGSIDKLCNNGKRSKREIAEAMLSYNRAGGKVLEGLVRRRRAEHDLFVKPDVTESKKYEPAAKKGISEIAKEIIEGKWGDGIERKTKLLRTGYDYDDIQREVNKLLSGNKTRSVKEIAQEVIDGKWGNGIKRKYNIIQAGYDYAAVQKEVNNILKGGKS